MALLKEKQERSFIKAVNDAVKKNDRRPINIEVSSKLTIPSVIRASKCPKPSGFGESEPYTDVILETGSHTPPPAIRLSLKQRKGSPSLAGGGFRGVKKSAPGLAERFMKTALKHLLTKLKLKAGDQISDIFAKISSENDKRKVVTGVASMGGPIDFLYFGNKMVKSKFNEQTGTLKIEGEFISADEFAKSTLYFRLRRRSSKQVFDPVHEKDGMPVIYSKDGNNTSGQLVVVDSVPAGAIVIKL